jgi:hypothetical protein
VRKDLHHSAFDPRHRDEEEVLHDETLRLQQRKGALGEGVRRSLPGKTATRPTGCEHTRGPVTAFKLRQRCPVRARRSESSAIRVWRSRKHTTVGKREDSSAARDHSRRPNDGGTMQRCLSRMHRAHHRLARLACLPAACLVPLTHARLRLTHAAAAASLKSLHLSALRRPRIQVELHARAIFSPIISAAFPLANLLPHPRTARLLLQPYQLRLSFHYTLIPAHVPAFPSSALCCLPTVRPVYPTL